METYINNNIEIISSEFNTIADKFLNCTMLIVNDKKYRILEIEFYLYCKDHLDGYSHQHSDQLMYGEFYFHRHKNGIYRGGNYKGMDFCLGNIENKKYCGILIRSIMNSETNKITEGPCLTVNKILEEYKYSSITEFLNTENKLQLQDYKHQKEIIYVGPRVGLDLKKLQNPKFPEFIFRNYRYLIYKDKIKKEIKNYWLNLIW